MRGRPITSIEERLYRNVIKVKSTDCWEWQGGTNNLGFGMIRDNDLKGMRTTHRVSYEATHGSIPKGKCVLHKCNNVLCCNPDHLVAGTRKELSFSMVQQDRHNHYGHKVHIKCDHCPMIAQKGLIVRWHNDNCKHKPKK